jgi:hypothetical protein
MTQIQMNTTPIPGEEVLYQSATVYMYTTHRREYRWTKSKI